MVLAGVKLLRVHERQILSHCVDGAVSPLVHEGSQVEVVVDSIVVELFLLNLICDVLERSIEPLK